MKSNGVKLNPSLKRSEPRRHAWLSAVPRAGIYSRVDFKRPAVVRKANMVVTCYLWESARECLADKCFWPRIGKCNVFKRLLKNGKKGRK